jgi:serine/threonine-protein kinase
MRQPGPLWTLLAGVLLAGGLFAAQTVKGNGLADAAKPPASPHSTQAPDRGDYVGVVDGSGAVELSVRDGHVIGYVCDGTSVQAWFHGDMSADGRVDLHAADGAALGGAYGAGTVTGTVTAGLKSSTFVLRAARKPAGLYRATGTTSDGRPYTAGWIVQPNGSQVGILTVGATSTPAPRLDTATDRATIDGTPVTAESLSGLTGTGDFR